MTKQGYNYLDWSIQEMISFFETRAGILEASVPTAVKKPPKNKKKGNSKKQKVSSYEDSDKDSSEDEKTSSRKKFCQYQGKCTYSTDECITLNALMKSRSNPTSPKDTRKEVRKRTTNMISKERKSVGRRYLLLKNRCF